MRLSRPLPVLVLLVGATLGAIPLPAADGERPGTAALIERFDIDHDGTLSEGERAAAKAAHQQRRTQRQAKLRERHPDLFARLDANGDGTIDEQEAKAAKAGAEARAATMKERHPEAFAKLDADHDGVLDREELRAGRQARSERRTSREAGGTGAQ